jgi:hypothetical protein
MVVITPAVGESVAADKCTHIARTHAATTAAASRRQDAFSDDFKGSNGA